MELDLFFRAADAIKKFEPPADIERKEQKFRVQRWKEGNHLSLHTGWTESCLFVSSTADQECRLDDERFPLFWLVGKDRLHRVQ